MWIRKLNGRFINSLIEKSASFFFQDFDTETQATISAGYSFEVN